MTAQPTASARVHWPSVFQFGLSALAAAFLFLAAALSAMFAVLNAADPQVGPQQAVVGALSAAGMLLSGALVSLSAFYAGLRLFGRRAPTLAAGSLWRRLYRPAWWLLALPPVILLGWLAAFNPWAALVFLPPLHIFGVSLPVFFLAWLARRKLVDVAPQRYWGVFAAGLVGGPLLISVLEIVSVVVMLVAYAIYLLGQPGLVQGIEGARRYLNSTPMPDPERLIPLAEPLLSDPGLVVFVLLAFAVVAPIIEEALKPLGVWLLAGRKMTGGEGFAAGALSGAAFALFENVTRGVGASEWTVLIFVRIGTALLHILTSGLVGYGIALAWRERRVLKLLAAYVAAVCLHGLWNGSVMLMALRAVGNILSDSSGFPVPLYWLVAGPAVLLVLTIGMLLLVLFANRSLRTPAAIEAAEVPQTPLTE